MMQPDRSGSLQAPVETGATRGLHYSVHGPADAPAVVLVHGTRRTRAMWRPQVAALSAHYRVITVDLPAHGVLAAQPFSFLRAVALLVGVIDRVAGGPAILVGQSLGGYVAMELAARRPDRVAGLVLVGSTAEPRTVIRRSLHTAVAFLVATAAGRNADPAAGHEPDAVEGRIFRGYRKAIREILARPFVPRLAAYAGPTLIVNGEHDAIFRREQELFRRAAGGRSVVIPACGHRANEEQPDHFNTQLATFLGELPGAR